MNSISSAQSQIQTRSVSKKEKEAQSQAKVQTRQGRGFKLKPFIYLSNNLTTNNYNSNKQNPDNVPKNPPKKTLSLTKKNRYINHSSSNKTNKIRKVGGEGKEKEEEKEKELKINKDKLLLSQKENEKIEKEKQKKIEKEKQELKEKEKEEKIKREQENALKIKEKKENEEFLLWKVNLPLIEQEKLVKKFEAALIQFRTNYNCRYRGANIQIKDFQNILNSSHLQRFYKYIQKLPIDNRSIDIVYHGTDEGAFNSIVSSGLKIPDGVTVIQKHGASYGKGIYCSNCEVTAISYGTMENVGGIFVCFAARGKTTVTRDQYRTNESYVDNSVQSHTVYLNGISTWQSVIFNNDGIIPAYLIRLCLNPAPMDNPL